MPNSKQTVVQRFWTRVFDSPSEPALLVRNDKTEPQVFPVVSAGMPPHVVVIHPKPYINVNYVGLGAAVMAITAYLRKNGFKRGDRASILAWNCPEWVIADLAIQSLGGITVPIYPHSTAEQVNYVLRDSGARFLFSNEKAQLAKADTALGCQIVFFDDIPGKIEQSLKDVKRPFVSWFTEEVLFSKSSAALVWPSIAKETQLFDRVVTQEPCCGITRDDIATIIYTSGSTGQPKGVVLTHGAFAAGCEGMVAHGFELSAARKDVYLSYLPLAHVYERAAGEMLCLWLGIPMAFCKVDEVGEVVKLVRPTAMHGVPAVWRKVKDKVDANLRAATGIKAKLIAWAFAQNEPGFKRWLADKLVFAKIRAELGGRLRITTSGGAPISPDVLEFYNQVGIELLQGYGLTETTGASVVNRPRGNAACFNKCNKVGSVGHVVPGLKVRIAPLAGREDAGEGEIQFFGETVTKGYWNLPEETTKLFTEDGWLKTGDLGKLDDEGFLFITGRIKRLLKTDGGKYVAPDKIEKAFEGDSIVQYVVPVGDGKPFISGLIFVNQIEAKALLARKGITLAAGGDTPAHIAVHPVVVEAVNAALASANGKLERWETLKKIHIIEDEATIPGGLLTPTLKIRTEEVLKRYSTAIAAFYEKPKAN